MKIPNNITGCIKLLKKEFPNEFCTISKGSTYFHDNTVETVYIVYISKNLKSHGLNSFRAVKFYVESAIKNKESIKWNHSK